MGESGGGHQAEQVSWTSVQGDPRHYPGGDRVANTLHCGSQQCGPELDLTDGGVWSSHPGRTGTCSGMEPGCVVHGSWPPGIAVPGVAAGCLKRPHRTVPVDRFGGQRC